MGGVAEWSLAPELAALRREILARWPGTTIGSYATSGHVKDSDHYPDPRTGQVNALDVHTGPGAPDGDRLVAQLVGDDRLAYVIYNRRIYSKSHGWAPRPYTGDNPHTGHVHISYDPATGDQAGGGGGWAGRLTGAAGAVAQAPGALLDKLNPFDDWAAEARRLAILGIVLAGATGLVVLGVQHGVQSKIRTIANI